MATNLVVGGEFASAGAKPALYVAQWTRAAGCCNMAGDANNDGVTNVGDQVFIVNHVFKSLDCATNPPIGCAPDCGAEGDANADGAINVGDIVYINNYVFKSLECATSPPIGCPPGCGPEK